MIVVETARLEHSVAPQFVLTGSYDTDAPSAAVLSGPRMRVAGSIRAADGRFEATIPAVAARWGSEALPLPSGSYTFEAGATATARATPSVLEKGLFRWELTGAAELRIEPPLRDDERGQANQARLEREYRSWPDSPERAVFFESFWGQNASCNPRAIDRELASRQPDVIRYWSTVDASIALPDGAVRVVEGSLEWWQARASARLLVVNDWLRKRWRKRAHQTVLQTWHGTMLKKLALSRWKLGPRPAAATLLERGRWDVLLAQNPHSREVFRRAYAWTGPVWEEGYPRDDQLVTGDGALVRSRLGIPEGRIVVLYAPTWRDDRPQTVDHLDVERFTAALGPEYVTLIRGHSRSLRPGRDVDAPAVLDVTGYPDVADLFLAADVLVTDYSSVMFDFSVTGKPIFFFTPDLEDYRDRLRGFYFDLIEVAPGPVVQTAGELVSLVRDRDQVARDYEVRYARWRERFNPRDDGRAAERVVDRILREGLL